MPHLSHRLTEHNDTAIRTRNLCHDESLFGPSVEFVRAEDGKVFQLLRSPTKTKTKSVKQCGCPSYPAGSNPGEILLVFKEVAWQKAIRYEERDVYVSYPQEEGCSIPQLTVEALQARTTIQSSALRLRGAGIVGVIDDRG